MTPRSAGSCARQGLTVATVATTFATLLVVLPRVAQACAVCFGGKDSDWSGGFLLGTTLMLMLPPAIVICAGFAIWRAMKRQEARLRERDAAAASAPRGIGQSPTVPHARPAR